VHKTDVILPSFRCLVDNYYFTANATFCPLCVFVCPCGFHTNQLLFPSTALTGWLYAAAARCLLCDVRTDLLGSIPGHSTWDLCFTKCHCDSFSPITSVFPCQYHFTNAPYPFIHLPPTLYNVSLPVLQFCPVSIISPMLHTHSFTYHPRYIMFLSQYFSFPLSVPFYQCSIPIHSPLTHTI